jgi:hypothetical protein
MLCAKCGGEVKPTDTTCPNCSTASSKLQVIDPIESIDEEEKVRIEEGPGYYEYRSTGPNHRVYVKQVNMSRMGFWPMLLGLVVFLVVIILALPLAIFFAIAGSIFWFFLRRR